MREHVITQQQVGAVIGADHLFCRAGTEETNERRNSFGLCRGGDVGRGLYSKDRDATRREVLEKIAIITRYLHYPVRRREPEPCRDVVNVGLTVLQPRIGIRREV